MNKLLWQSSLALATVTFLAACGDEMTNVTKATGPTSVAKFKDLDECAAGNDGALVYVKDSAAVYLCSDNVWNALSVSAANGSNGTNGADGKDGKDGTACTATALEDGSGSELTCGDKVIGTISNGVSGSNGLKGRDGKSCEGKANEDGSVTISCDGKDVATIKDGEAGKSTYELSGSELTLEQWLDSLNGEDGKGCTAKSVDGGVQITCGDSQPVKLKDGTNGKDITVDACRIASDEDGVVTLSCANGNKTTTQKLYKATCGNEPYDPETHTCDFDETKRTFTVKAKSKS